MRAFVSRFLRICKNALMLWMLWLAVVYRWSYKLEAVWLFWRGRDDKASKAQGRSTFFLRLYDGGQIDDKIYKE